VWTPPGAEAAAGSPDFTGNGIIDAEDLFLLVSRWYRHTREPGRYVIFARAWARGTTGEAFSDGDVIVPKEYPTREEGLLELMRQWHKE
jgi:hypothetical protein